MAKPPKGGDAKLRVYSQEATIAGLPKVYWWRRLWLGNPGRFLFSERSLRMFSLSRYKKKGLPYGLIRLHEFLVEDMIVYFEKGKLTRKKIKEARKSSKQALKVAKKKKINPGVKINQAREALEELREELDYTRKVLRVTGVEMDNAIRHIEEERIGEVLALMDRARERFRNKEIEKGLEVLKESQSKMEKKILDKTRKVVLTGIHSDVKNLKYELEERQSKKASKQEKPSSQE
jgi:hypothetical protein